MKIYLGTTYKYDKTHYFYDNRKGFIYVIVDLQIYGIKRNYHNITIDGDYIGTINYVRFTHLLPKPLNVVASFDDIKLVLEKLIFDKL